MTAAPAGRATRMIAAHRADLDRIVRADPSATHREIAARFRAETGRGVSATTLKLARRRLGLPHPGTPTGAPAMPAPIERPGTFLALPRDQAEALAWIAAHRPDLTPIDCVALLAAEMDRHGP